MTSNAISRGNTPTGAEGEVFGTISRGATWYEDFSVTEDNAAVANAEDFTWTLTLKKAGCSSVDLALTLGVSQGTNETVLQIRSASTSLSSLEGDYLCDIYSRDPTDTTVEPGGRIRHRAHGTVVMVDEPPR